MAGEKEKQAYFMSLYEPHHERFARYCMAVTHNEHLSQDLINETLLRAYEGFDKIRNKESFLFYLFGVAKRIWLTQIRRRKFWKETEDIEEEKLSSRNLGESRLEAHFLYKAMDELSDEQKEAIILFEISGLSIKEIVKIQESTESAVKARLARGRRRLALLLMDKEISK